MIDLTTSKVVRAIVANVKLCRQPGSLALAGTLAEVQTMPSRNVVVVSFNGAVFAGVFTKAGWRALPAMTSLAGKKLYTDAEAETAVKAIFASVKDAADWRRPGHAPGHE